MILAYGAIVSEALRARELLAARGRSVGVILLERLKPYGALSKALMPYLRSAPRVLFLEEGIHAGGAGMLLGDALSAAGLTAPYSVKAIRDHFASPDVPVDLRAFCGIAAEDVAKPFLM